MGSISGRVIPKPFKLVPVVTLLDCQHYMATTGTLTNVILTKQNKPPISSEVMALRKLAHAAHVIYRDFQSCKNSVKIISQKF